MGGMARFALEVAGIWIGSSMTLLAAWTMICKLARRRARRAARRARIAGWERYEQRQSAQQRVPAVTGGVYGIEREIETEYTDDDLDRLALIIEYRARQELEQLDEARWDRWLNMVVTDCPVDEK